MPYVWSHKVFVVLILLQMIKGKRWRDARLDVRAHARTHKASPAALSCAHSHSLIQGGIEREGGVWTLRSSRGFREYTVQTQTRQSVLEPDEFLDSTSIWRGARLRAGNAQARIAESGTCRDHSMPAQQLGRLRYIYDCGVCSVLIVVL